MRRDHTARRDLIGARRGSHREKQKLKAQEDAHPSHEKRALENAVREFEQTPRKA